MWKIESPKKKWKHENVGDFSGDRKQSAMICARLDKGENLQKNGGLKKKMLTKSRFYSSTQFFLLRTFFFIMIKKKLRQLIFIVTIELRKHLLMILKLVNGWKKNTWKFVLMNFYTPILIAFSHSHTHTQNERTPKKPRKTMNQKKSQKTSKASTRQHCSIPNS